MKGGLTLTGNATVSGTMTVNSNATIGGSMTAATVIAGGQNVITYIDNKYNELKARIAALEAVLMNNTQ